MTSRDQAEAGRETYDLIVRGGQVVDGTGLPRRRIDIGVRNGRIARMALLDEAEEIVAP